MNIWFTKIPLPPSVNKWLIPAGGLDRRTGKYWPVRLAKSKEHKAYVDDIILWSRQHPRDRFDDAKQKLFLEYKRLEALQGHASFRVDCYFALQKNRIFSANNRVESLDVDNMVKPLLDGMTKVIEIDDRFHFAVYSEKVTVYSKESECVLVNITSHKPRTLTEVLLTANLETS